MSRVTRRLDEIQGHIKTLNVVVLWTRPVPADISRLLVSVCVCALL